jgi:hypothetical protein
LDELGIWLHTEPVAALNCGDFDNQLIQFDIDNYNKIKTSNIQFLQHDILLQLIKIYLARE